MRHVLIYSVELNQKVVMPISLGKLYIIRCDMQFPPLTLFGGYIQSWYWLKSWSFHVHLKIQDKEISSTVGGQGHGRMKVMVGIMFWAAMKIITIVNFLEYLRRIFRIRNRKNNKFRIFISLENLHCRQKCVV